MNMQRVHRKPPRGSYIVAGLLGITTTVLAERAVSFYHTAQRMVPSDEHLHRSLETILHWRDAAGQRVEQVDTLLQQQAYDVALQSLQMPYFFQSAAASAVAVCCVVTAVYVALQNKRN